MTQSGHSGGICLMRKHFGAAEGSCVAKRSAGRQRNSAKLAHASSQAFAQERSYRCSVDVADLGGDRVKIETAAVVTFDFESLSEDMRYKLMLATVLPRPIAWL
jgi:hypothetical protein